MESVDKPGSVESDHSSVTPVARMPIATYPNPTTGRGIRIPIWSCSGWGLHCHSCYQKRGALLPHHFTLTQEKIPGRYIFCCTFRRLTPPRRYLASCPVEPGLSSALKDSDHLTNSVCKITSSGTPTQCTSALAIICFKSERPLI